MIRWSRIVMMVALGTGAIRVVQAQDLVLQVATRDHPHIQALKDGRVKAQDCTLRLSTQTLETLNADLTGAKQFDVLEVDVVRFLEKYSAGELQEYILIPVFLTREFQLRNIYIRADRGIAGPRDLRGKTIGVAGYGSATPTWIRGIMQSSWSVKPGDVTWRDSESAAPAPKSLAEWIQKGEVDAIFSRLPQNEANVVRLFTNFREAELATFKANRVFPIGSALAIRKTIARENPWVSEAVFLAFSASKKAAMTDHKLPVPWEGFSQLETQERMGENFWSYGVKNNPKTLGALFRYLQEQKLLKQPLTIEDVFVRSTLMLLED